MTSLKPFMAWAIGSNPRSPQSRNLPPPPLTAGSPVFHALSRQLLAGYLGATGLVLCLFATAMYQFFAYSLRQDVDQQLAMIADAARHNLPMIQTNPAAATQRLPVAIDTDGDLDLPWQDLQAGMVKLDVQVFHKPPNGTVILN